MKNDIKPFTFVFENENTFMGFFDYFYSKKNTHSEPTIQFGRFSDSYKEASKYYSWDQSMDLFRDKNYFESYRYFFDYLTDDSVDNLTLQEEEDGILSFEIFQGSKKITGTASNTKFKAEAKIAKSDALHLGFLRKLLEDNYQLKYCRYALDKDDNVTILFETNTMDGSPYKLYHALKELATHADNKDDLLVSEFDSLKPINNGHVRQINNAEIKIKYEYLLSEIDAVLDQIDNSKLNIDKYPGAVSYVFLNLIYKMDYLVKPEGNLMESIDTIHKLFFDSKSKDSGTKNSKIKKELLKIKDISYTQFSKEIYIVKSTFGITQTSSLKEIQKYIQSEIKNMDWYFENEYLEYALAIPSYIVGYCFFVYGMPAPLRELFNLFYQITEFNYFENLNIKGRYVSKGKLQSSTIKREVKVIISAYAENFPSMEMELKYVSFDNIYSFSKTYLLMIGNMNFNPKNI